MTQFLRFVFLFLFSIIFAQATIAQDCSQSIPGFTKLGEFEGNGYYLSDVSNLNWTQANLQAQADGQNLVSINSQEENDFLNALVSDIIAIGVTDLDTEGTPYWINGDEFDFSNFSSCSWCAPNDDVHNFGFMTPWDGQWILDHYFRSARYVIELPCGAMTSDLALSCPENLWMEVPDGQYSVVMSWDLPTATTDCMVSDVIAIAQVGGETSGATFFPGIYTIEYQATDNCASLEECTFTVTVTEPANEGCGEIDGFTYFGDFEGHGYYMSDEASTWSDAKDFAEAAGGNLVTINSQNENAYVQLHLGNEMVFIGFNDVATEATGAWANGETSTVDLSYGNSAQNDFAVMNFWNGQWVMVNQYVYKKYILEVDCGAPPATEVTIACPANIDAIILEGDTDVSVSWDLPTASTTCDITDNPAITQTVGQASGTSFAQGNHVVTYSASDDCGNTTSCSFDVLVSSEGGASCGEIAGYTLIGEYAGHAYYLSDVTSQWTDAKFQSVADGGYLTVISDQAENDFLQGAIGNNQPFIGFADELNEGTGAWPNGEPVALDLSYGNSEINDFAVINFWAGTWQMVNQWVSLKYVMEVNCGGAPQGMVAPTPKVTANSIYDIYPNPANDFISARIVTKEDRMVNVSIYDARGQVFLSENKNLPKGASELEFNISDLPTGMYYLKLGNGQYERFVKID